MHFEWARDNGYQALEQEAYGCVLGKDYPNTIVATKETYKHASNILWHMKRNPNVRRESKRILAMHTLPDRENIMDRWKKNLV